MSKRVFKYPLPGSMNEVKLPAGAKVLSVGWHSGQPVMWAEVGPQPPQVSRWFFVSVTSADLHEEPGAELKFIGTTGNLEMTYVVHVYEVVYT